MAERIVRQLIDDIDGSDISDGSGESLQFTFRGVGYKIDLSKANSVKFEKALKPYVDAAERVSGPPRPRRSKSTSNGRSTRKNLDAIRRWARKNGHEVSARGRIPVAVVNAFDAAH